MTHATLLGAVERFGAMKSGRPGARLRPLFQASPDKKSWIKPWTNAEDDFPNSGVVSWWEPSADAEEQKVWTFQFEPSWSFDRERKNHDSFMVKGIPSPALELIVLPKIDDLEDARAFFVEEGLRLDACASRRLMFRDRSGLMVGPLDFTIRGERLYLDDRDAPIALYESTDDLAFGEWNGHLFLPLEAPIRRVGDIDFSSNTVFLKHVLREIKELPSTLLADAKLTKKLIAQYTSAFEKVSLTPLQVQRLKRLGKLAARASVGVSLSEEAASDLLSLPAVKGAISDAKEQAVRHTLEERRAVLNELENRRSILEGEVEGLRTEAGRLRDEIASSREEHDALLTGFDSRVQSKFEEVEKNATSFLADVAVIRAALSTTVQPKASPGPVVTGQAPYSEPLSAEQLVKAVRRSFDVAGLGCILPTVLLSSWASGFVPMLFGVIAHDALTAASESLFGGNLHFATLGPTMTSAADLLGIPAASPFGVSTVSELIGAASRSNDLGLLIFENVNLAQLDSLLLPLFRPYASFQAECRTEAMYPTPLGTWPANLLLAGILIDSPLALPISRELWTYSTFIDASTKRTCASARAAEPRVQKGLLGVTYEAWVEWLRTIEHESTSDTRVIAAHLAREVESSSLFKRMSRRLAKIIDQTAPGTSEATRAGLLVEMLVPYVLCRGMAPGSLLEDAPAGVSTEDGFIDMVTTLFEKWGLEAR